MLLETALLETKQDHRSNTLIHVLEQSVYKCTHMTVMCTTEVCISVHT